MSARLGTFIRELRLSRRLSMRELEKKARVHRSTLSRWESGKATPFVPELKAALSALAASEEQCRQAYQMLDATRAVGLIREDQQKHSGVLGNAPSGGELLRAMRFRKGYTLEQLASALGVQHSTISRWERCESWPSKETLQQLCFVLDADEQELAALLCGRFSLTPPTAVSSINLRDVLQKHYTTMLTLRYFDFELADLRWLSLEAELWTLAKQHPAARELLHYAYGFHAQTLSDWNRLTEAEIFANRALDIRPEKTFNQFTMNAVLAAARSSVYKREKPNPKRGREIVEMWLPMINSPAYHAWALSYLAEYEMLMGRAENALKIGEQSVEVSVTASNITEQRLRKSDQALLLARANQPQKALELLPKLGLYDKGVSYLEMIAQAKVYYGVNDFGMAKRWLDRFYELIIERRVEHLRSHGDALERQLARQMK